MTNEKECWGSYWRGEGAKRGTRQDRGQMCRKEEVREGVPWQFSIEVTYVVASLVSACIGQCSASIAGHKKLSAILQQSLQRQRLCPTKVA
jgi:hypothetical protein